MMAYHYILPCVVQSRADKGQGSTRSAAEIHLISLVFSYTTASSCLDVLGGLYSMTEVFIEMAANTRIEYASSSPYLTWSSNFRGRCACV